MIKRLPFECGLGVLKVIIYFIKLLDLSVKLHVDRICLFIHWMNVLQYSVQSLLALLLGLMTHLNHLLTLRNFCHLCWAFVSTCKKFLCGCSLVARVFEWLLELTQFGLELFELWLVCLHSRLALVILNTKFVGLDKVFSTLKFFLYFHYGVLSFGTFQFGYLWYSILSICNLFYKDLCCFF